jgi:hypothetical protein
MGELDAAQAVEPIRALCDALDEMTRQLPWLEHRGAQLEAAALRHDINEAQIHINRLQRRYLTSTPPRANSLNRPGETATTAEVTASQSC